MAINRRYIRAQDTRTCNHTLCFINLPPKRSVTGSVVLGAVMVAVVLMVQEVEMLSGDGEEEGGGLKQRSSELQGLLLSTSIKSKRSRLGEAVALVLLSEGAKGS